MGKAHVAPEPTLKVKKQKKRKNIYVKLIFHLTAKAWHK